MVVENDIPGNDPVVVEYDPFTRVALSFAYGNDTVTAGLNVEFTQAEARFNEAEASFVAQDSCDLARADQIASSPGLASSSTCTREIEAF